MTTQVKNPLPVDAVQGVTSTNKPDHSTKNNRRNKSLDSNIAESNDKTKTSPPFFSVQDRGVYYHWNKESRWICSKLEIKALVRDKISENWGRLLVFRDADHQVHVWSMPMEMLKGSGEELRGELLRLGLEIAPGLRARQLLIEYITTTKPTTRARCVTRTGWYDTVFVFPTRTIGKINETVIYQSENPSRDYQQAGTLEEWQTHVAQLCVGNSRLVFAISTAFAAMLLTPAHRESGGLHFVGESSTGKTTALRVAASVYGGKDYLNRWRATTNGLEALATLHSDTLLVLDELAQVDPKEAGEMAYLLANGSGKARAGKTGAARTRSEWRILFLSAGEIGLSQYLQQAGKKVKAGQAVRLVDIPADAGIGLGLFENIHHTDSSASFSKLLADSAEKYYGTAAIAFLERLMQPSLLPSLALKINTFIDAFIKETLPLNACGQVHRVCERFALIAMAGELATQFHITNWPPQEATRAAQRCFRSWLEQRGSIDNLERTTLLAQVRHFFEVYGESRFTAWTDTHAQTLHRAGFKKTNDNETRFYVFPEVFRHEICTDFDARTAARLLVELGWIIPESPDTAYRREYLPGIGRCRCYLFTTKLWEA